MTLKTFKDIFSDGRWLIIPRIQRDYAQGRESASATEIRNNFIKALHKALVSGKGINLDFIYGSIENLGKHNGDTDTPDSMAFIPLDGQQRLTTLYLLHWLASRHEEKYAESEFLKRFSYETRYTTRRFCEFLMGDFKPTFSGKLSEEIKEHPDFVLSWNDDPSVKGMLTMIDALEEKFYGASPVENLWDKLPLITFNHEDIDDMEASDEVYIKMNSRGKPLTHFEHFKAELDNVMNDNAFALKMDTDWTDIFWALREESGKEDELPVVDDAFLRYIHFIANVICLKTDGQYAPDNDFEMIERVFSHKTNQKILSDALSCWEKVNTADFFGNIFSKKTPDCPTLLININGEVDLLHKLCRGEQFPMRDIILLWGCVTYRLHKDIVKPEEFARRMRTLRNLTMNAQDEYRPERYSAMFHEAERLILHGSIDLASNSYNQAQKEEEARKLEWLQTVDMTHEMQLTALENNDVLYGSTTLIGLDNYHLFPTFNTIFSPACSSWEIIARALLACGDVSYNEVRWRVLIPGPGKDNDNKLWREYFRPRADEEFNRRVHAHLSDLLAKYHSGKSCEDIVNEWLDSPRESYDWRYYMVKYPAIIRYSGFGKYWFPGESKTNNFYSMATRASTSGRHREAILLAISNEKTGWEFNEKGDYGGPLSKSGTAERLFNTPDFLELKDASTEPATPVSTYTVPRAKDGADMIDRVSLIPSFAGQQ